MTATISRPNVLDSRFHQSVAEELGKKLQVLLGARHEILFAEKNSHRLATREGLAVAFSENPKRAFIITPWGIFVAISNLGDRDLAPVMDEIQVELRLNRIRIPELPEFSTQIRDLFAYEAPQFPTPSFTEVDEKDAELYWEVRKLNLSVHR